MATITTKSGRTATLMAHVDQSLVLGLDRDGRIVMDSTDDDCGFLFALTLCCQAYDKGASDGVVCRSCYGMDDVGAYLFIDPKSGACPDLDVLVSLQA